MSKTHQSKLIDEVEEYSSGLSLAKKAKTHDEQKHPRGPDGRWIAAGAIGLGALGLGAYLLLRRGGKPNIPAPSVSAPAPKKTVWTFKVPATPGPKPPMAPAPKPAFTPAKPVSRLNEPKVELQKPTIVKPISKKELTLADLKAAAKEAKEKGKLLVYRGHDDGPEFWGGTPDPSAIFEKPTTSTWVTPNRSVANSWAKHPHNQKDKFRKNPTVQAFLLPRSGVVDLSDPEAMKQYRKYWASDLADRYRYKDIEERKRAAQYMRSAKFVPERQEMAVSDPDSYKYVTWDRRESAKNILAARHVIRTGKYEGAPKNIEKKVWENYVSANKMMREPINNDYSGLRTYARKRGKSGVYDPGEMDSPPRIHYDTGKPVRDPQRGGFFLRHPQAIIYNKDMLENIGRLPVKKSDASLPMAKFSPLSQAELEQRRAAGRASAEKRRGKGKYYGKDTGEAPGVVQSAWGQKGSGRDKETRIKSVLGSHYRAHLDKEFSDVVPESAGRGGFKEFAFTPQRPSHMSDEDYNKVALRAGQVTKALKDPIIQGAVKAGKIPPGTDPKTVNRAFAHARLLALHEVGLGKYHFRMEDQTKETMKPLVPFIWYARRRLTQDPQGLRPQFKGQWKQFKDEYGEPFKDNRKDPRTGEVRRRFYPHMELLRADQGLPLTKGWKHDIGPMVSDDGNRNRGQVDAARERAINTRRTQVFDIDFGGKSRERVMVHPGKRGASVHRAWYDRKKGGGYQAEGVTWHSDENEGRSTKRWSKRNAVLAPATLDKADQGIPLAKFMAGSMTGKAISSIWNGARSIAPQAWQKLAPSSSKVYDGVGAGMKRGLNSLFGMAAGAQGRQAIAANYKSRLKAGMPQANRLAGASKDPIRTRAWAMRLNRPAFAKTRSVLAAFPRGRALDIGAGAGLVGGAGYMMSGSNKPPPTSYRMY